MAAPGWAAVTLNVNNGQLTVGIQISGTTTIPVTSSDGTTQINYTVGAPVYDTTSHSTPGWLVRTPNGLTTPSSLTLSNLFTAGVLNGAFATVTLTPDAASGAAAVTITVTPTGTGTGANGGTLSASQTSVALTNSTLSANVTITNNAATALSITPSTAVQGAVSNWLNGTTVASSIISPGATTTVTVLANPFSLATGVYQGTVTLTPSSGTALNISVTLTVGSSIGNGTWTASPGSVGFNFTTNSGVFPTTSVQLTGPSTSPTYSVLPSCTNAWLTFFFPTIANSDQPTLSAVPVGTPFGLKVAASANSLPTGLYVCQAVVLDSSGTPQLSLNVTLTVNGGVSTSLTVNPNPVNFNVAVNAAQQSQVVTVTSASGGNLSVSAVGSLPSSLTFQLPTSTAVGAGGNISFTVFANPAGLAAATYSGTLSVTVGAQTIQVPVNMIVGGGGTGTTAVAPTSLNFAYQLGTDPLNFISRQNLVITGPAGAWSSSISTDNSLGWLKMSQTAGSALPSADGGPIVTADATGLAAGTYGGTINIKTPGGTQGITVTLTVGASTILLPTPGDLVFIAQSGSGKSGGQTIVFSGSDGKLNPLAISTVSNNSFISVTNDAASMTVFVDPTGLPTGVYSGSVSVTQAGANTLTVPVILVLNGGGSGGTGGGNSNVTVSATTLNFTAAFGTSPAAQTISVTSASGSAGVAFTVTPSTTPAGSWLTTNAGATNTTPVNNLSVSVNSSSLPAGSYTGNLLITPTGGTPVNVAVNLTISAPAGVTATPASLTFNFQAGAAAPAAQTITVAGGSGSAFTVTAASTGNWLVATAAAATTPSTVSVTVNATGLAAGTYTGTVTVAGASGAPGTTVVNVTLNVTAPLPTLSGIINAASGSTGSIAPGEIISLFGTDPAHPIGPATAVGLTLDSNGNVATTIGGVQVIIAGFACPMVFASSSQVSAVVPYEIKRFTSANVFVKFLGQSSNGVPVNVVTTLPGLFTQNAQGSGPGSILNSDNSVNSPSNPAARGGIVAVYLTGEGETSPAGTTGKVTPAVIGTPTPLLPVSVTVGGQPANFTFAGEAPGLISGVMQVNVLIPTNITVGNQPIVVSVGGIPSQQGVTVSLK